MEGGTNKRCVSTGGNKKVAKDPVQSLQITIFFECDAV
jgi:hypothetical protein